MGDPVEARECRMSVFELSKEVPKGDAAVLLRALVPVAPPAVAWQALWRWRLNCSIDPTTLYFLDFNSLDKAAQLELSADIRREFLTWPSEEVPSRARNQRRRFKPALKPVRNF